MEHLTNIFDNFLVSHENLIIENLQQDRYQFKVNFVLTEAKKQVTKSPQQTTERPWGRESWLETNPKIEKNSKVREKVNGKTIVFHSYIINLLPAEESGINVCACATADCKRTCLHQSGNVGMLVGKSVARFRKTWYLYLDTDEAVNEITRQIRAKKNKIDKLNEKNLPYLDFVYDEDSGEKVVDSVIQRPVFNKKGMPIIDPKTGDQKITFKKIYKKEPVENPYHVLVIRLNGTSDLNWVEFPVGGAKNIFELFPDVVFYDYTKFAGIADSYIKEKDFPPNYHITFSYGGGANEKNTQVALRNGINVAVAFGPGKTHSTEELKFPNSLQELVGASFKYPLKNDGSDMTGQEQDAYKNELLRKIKKECFDLQEGDTDSNLNLSEFAGQTLLPGLFDCHEVIDGDSYDGRFLDDYYFHEKPEDEFFTNSKTFQVLKKDKPAVVVGLTAKGPLTFDFYDESGWDFNKTGKFVVGPFDKFLNTSKCNLANIKYTTSLDILIRKTDLYKKLVKAIFMIRNADARHASRLLASPQGTLDARLVRQKEKTETQIKKSTEQPRQQDILNTYQTAKAKFDSEMDNVRFIFKCVMEPETLSDPNAKNRLQSLLSKKDVNAEESDKFVKVKEFAEKFNKHIQERIKKGHIKKKTADEIRKNLFMIIKPSNLLKDIQHNRTLLMSLPIQQAIARAFNEPTAPDTGGFKEWFFNQ